MFDYRITLAAGIGGRASRIIISANLRQRGKRIADAHPQQSADQLLSSNRVNAVTYRPANYRAQNMQRTPSGLSRRERDQNEKDRVNSRLIQIPWAWASASASDFPA